MFDAGALVARLNLNNSQFIVGLNQSSSKVADFARRVNAISFARVIRNASIAGVALAAPFVKATDAAADFQEQLGMVSTMLDKEAMPIMEEYSKELLKLSIRYGESTKTLSKGLYDILSATIAPSKALGVLDVSARAAAAGMTTTRIAADAITTVLNSYGWSAERAQEVSDSLFATVKRGKTTFAQLAPAIGMVSASAAKANMSLEEMGALISTITRNGILTDRAIIGVNNALLAFYKPQQAAITAAEEYGVTLNTTSLTALGFTRAMYKLQGAEIEQLAQIFGNIRGLRGMVAAFGDVEGVQEDMVLQFNRGGLTLEAYNKRVHTLNFQMGRMKQSFNALLVVIGDKFIDVATRLASSITKINEEIAFTIDSFGDLESFDKTALKGVVLVISAIGGAFSNIADAINIIRTSIKLAQVTYMEFYNNVVKGNGIIGRSVSKLISTFKKLSLDRSKEKLGLAERTNVQLKKMYDETLTDYRKMSTTIKNIEGEITRLKGEGDEALASILSDELSIQEEKLKRLGDKLTLYAARITSTNKDIDAIKKALLEDVVDFARVGETISEERIIKLRKEIAGLAASLEAGGFSKKWADIVGTMLDAIDALPAQTEDNLEEIAEQFNKVFGLYKKLTDENVEVLSDWAKSFGDSAEEARKGFEEAFAGIEDGTIEADAQLTEFIDNLLQLDNIDFEKVRQELLNFVKAIDDGISATEEFRQGWIKAIDEVAEAAGDIENIGYNMASSLRASFEDIFVSAFEGEIESMSDLWDRFTSALVTAFAQAMATIASAKMMGGLTSALGGITSMLSGIAGFGGLSSIGGMGAFAGAGGLGAAATLGVATAGMGALGGLFGTALSERQGTKYGGLGGALGAGAGFLARGPAGALLGGMIGGGLGSIVGPEKYKHAGTYSSEITVTADNTVKAFDRTLTAMSGAMGEWSEQIGKMPEWAKEQFGPALENMTSFVEEQTLSVYSKRYRDIAGHVAAAEGEIAAEMMSQLDALMAEFVELQKQRIAGISNTYADYLNEMQTLASASMGQLYGASFQFFGGETGFKEQIEALKNEINPLIAAHQQTINDLQFQLTMAAPIYGKWAELQKIKPRKPEKSDFHVLREWSDHPISIKSQYKVAMEEYNKVYPAWAEANEELVRSFESWSGVSIEQAGAWFQELTQSIEKSEAIIVTWTEEQRAELKELRDLYEEHLQAIQLALEQFGQTVVKTSLLEGFQATDIETGFESFKDAIYKNMYDAILEGIVDALMATEIYKNALTPLLNTISDAFQMSLETGTFDVSQFYALIQPMLDSTMTNLDALTPAFEAAYDVLAQIREQFGITMDYVPGGAADSSRNLLFNPDISTPYEQIENNVYVTIEVDGDVISNVVARQSQTNPELFEVI